MAVKDIRISQKMEKRLVEYRKRYWKMQKNK